MLCWRLTLEDRCLYFLSRVHILTSNLSTSFCGSCCLVTLEHMHEACVAVGTVIIHSDLSISRCVFAARDRWATAAGKPSDRDKENNIAEALTVLVIVCSHGSWDPHHHCVKVCSPLIKYDSSDGLLDFAEALVWWSV